MARIAPTHPALNVDGGVNTNHAATGTDFNRWYGEINLGAYGPATRFSGGLRLSWRTDATSVTLHVRYARCDEQCAVDLNYKCYRGGRKCRNQCRLALLLDGRPCAAEALDDDEVWESGGEHALELPFARGGVHNYTVVWPSGADIDFLGLTLAPNHHGQPAALLASAPPPALRYVAHGDSITQGFCGDGDSYPEQLARIAGWTPVDMGIQGL